jgi:hypothetical protein
MGGADRLTVAYRQEWALWKVIISTITLKLFYDG